MNFKTSLLSSMMIFPVLLFSSVELVDNSCATPHSIPQLDGITQDLTYSDDYSNKHSKDIYLSFATGVDGNFSMELLKDNKKKMKYQLFIGKSCDDLTLVQEQKFDYTHSVNLAVSSKQEYIIKVVKHSNGNSRYNISYNFKAVEALPLKELLQKIANEEQITPNVVVASLKAYYAQFDADVNVAVTLQLTPVYHLLHNNYDYYKDSILDMYSDKTNHRLLRMPMLEIIGYHLDDTSSLDAIKTVFADKPNSHYHPTEKEIISVAITIDLAKSNRDDRFMKLIDIASNGIFSFTTRLNSLIHLYRQLQSNTTVDKNTIKVRLEQLSQDILSSPNDFKDERYQNLLNDEVLQVINSL